MSEPIDIQVCYKHPDRKTLLRCTICDRPICLDCAISTADGYCCEQCAKGETRTSRRVRSRGAGIVLLPALLGFLGSFLLTKLVILNGLPAIALGVVLGTLIARTIRRMTENTDSTVILSAGIGAAIPFLKISLQVLKAVWMGQYNTLFRGTLPVGGGALYIIALCGAIWFNLKGLSFKGFKG